MFQRLKWECCVKNQVRFETYFFLNAYKIRDTVCSTRGETVEIAKIIYVALGSIQNLFGIWLKNVQCFCIYQIFHASHSFSEVIMCAVQLRLNTCAANHQHSTAYVLCSGTVPGQNSVTRTSLCNNMQRRCPTARREFSFAACGILSGYAIRIALWLSDVKMSWGQGSSIRFLIWQYSYFPLRSQYVYLKLLSYVLFLIWWLLPD